MNYRNKITKNKDGFAMVEMLIALGVSAIVIVFAYVIFSYATNKLHESRAISQIFDIEEGVEQLYANTYDYSDLTTQALIDGDIASKGNIIANETIASPWYGSDIDSIITIAPSANSQGAFTITIASVPTVSCTKVASAFMQYDLTVDGNKIKGPASLTVACAKDKRADIAITF